MNILFFLKPKASVVTIYDSSTLRQTLEVMEHYRYSAIPVLKKTGEYVGTISEGDILWYIKNKGNFNIYDAEKIGISDIKRYRDNLPIRIDEDMSNLINISTKENFNPVIDDRNMFIGIITRQDIINYFYKQQVHYEKQANIN